MPPSTRHKERPPCVRHIGFGWARWWPRTTWDHVQPDGPDTWHWYDQELDVLERLGISAHVVMRGKPKWAFAGSHPLPKDMQWPADDPGLQRRP